jgi:hypothetical protein
MTIDVSSAVSFTCFSAARGLKFKFYGQALQPAVDGLGVAMGIRPYIDDDLAAPPPSRPGAALADN